MTRDEVLEMAYQADLGMSSTIPNSYSRDMVPRLERFAALVAERTREECARVCFDERVTANCDEDDAYNQATVDCGAAIRSMKAY